MTGAVENVNSSEMKSLRLSLDLIYSKHVVMDKIESAEVSDINTTNTPDAMDDVGDGIVPM